MSIDFKTETKPESPTDKLARLRSERAKRDEPAADEQVLRAIEKEELIAKYSKELGPLGSEFVVVDTGLAGDPLVVVKKPMLVQWDKYTQSKTTPADRYDYIAPSIAHPSAAEYLAFRQRRVGIDISVSNATMLMIGNAAEIETGK